MERKNTPMVIALVLALVFVLAVVFGAKFVYSKAASGPTVVTDLGYEEADSAECQSFVDALPNKVGTFKRVPIADPAPSGAAAYKHGLEDELTIRCGVPTPDYASQADSVTENSGAQWLRISDNSGNATWFTLDTTPAVAVTAPEGSKAKKVTGGLDEAIGTLTHHEIDLPATPLERIDASAANETESCSVLNLPEKYGDHVLAGRPDSPTGSWLYTSDTRNPIEVRCGVSMSPEYAAGARLTQLDGRPWFTDSSGLRWWSMGTPTVAVFAPLDLAENVLADVSRQIGPVEDAGDSAPSQDTADAQKAQ
ncbi:MULTISPECIES: DUF3515 domain-containing protein [Corynebacterium]|uniref:DUF3515 domain-containing protein n=1 Tax=Corynebacterium TaxID=1716 RepID=UPI0008A510ED|nr:MULTISPECIES: DUF3515 domain-containing protein [Corynebacterium]OFO47460.1 hypothetical protein HMPREF3044_01175 [Corynebacterium sp. HMSC073D01]QQU87488.1 DUF3515 domain-containing protein [Corynebacterium glucuronolyticum]